jgi:hypothetical protein
VSPGRLAAARDRIGGMFRSLAGRNTVRFDPQFVADMTAVRTQYANILEPQRVPLFERFWTEVMGTGPLPAAMDGVLYQNVRSRLSRLAKNYAQTDPTAAQAFRGLRDALDNAARRSIAPDDAQLWDQARQQWGDLRTIEAAMSNTTRDAAHGNLGPTALAVAQRNRNPVYYPSDEGEMTRLSKVGTGFIRDPIPNSGTAERLTMTQLLTNPAALGTTLAAGVYDPMWTAGAVGAYFTLPRLIQMGYYSGLGQRYLNNQAAVPFRPTYDRWLGTSILTENIPGLIPVPLEE